MTRSSATGYKRHMIGERDRAEDIDGEALLSVLLLEGLLSGNRDDAARGPGDEQAEVAQVDPGLDFLTFVEGAPALDAYQRYLVAMARELDGSRPFVWPKIDCEGSHDGSQCWSVTCTCHNVRSCNMLAEWCNAVEAEEHGMSCTRAESSGCEK